MWVLDGAGSVNGWNIEYGVVVNKGVLISGEATHGLYGLYAKKGGPGVEHTMHGHGNLGHDNSISGSECVN